MKKFLFTFILIFSFTFSFALKNLPWGDSTSKNYPAFIPSYDTVYAYEYSGKTGYFLQNVPVIFPATTDSMGKWRTYITGAWAVSPDREVSVYSQPNLAGTHYVIYPYLGLATTTTNTLLLDYAHGDIYFDKTNASNTVYFTFTGLGTVIRPETHNVLLRDVEAIAQRADTTFSIVTLGTVAGIDSTKLSKNDSRDTSNTEYIMNKAVYADGDIWLNSRYTTWSAVSSAVLDGYLSSPFIANDTLYIATGSYGGSDDTIRIKALILNSNGQITALSQVSTGILSSSYGQNALWWQWDNRVYIASRGTVFRCSTGDPITGSWTGHLVDSDNTNGYVSNIYADGKTLYILMNINSNIDTGLYSSKNGTSWTKLTTFFGTSYSSGYDRAMTSKWGTLFLIINGGLFYYKDNRIGYITNNTGQSIRCLSNGDDGIYLFGGIYPNIGAFLKFDGRNIYTLSTVSWIHFVSGYYYNGRAYAGWDEGISSSGTTFIYSYDGEISKPELKGSDLSAPWQTQARVRSFINYKGLLIAFAGAGLGSVSPIYIKSDSIRDRLKIERTRPEGGLVLPTKSDISFDGTANKIQPADMNSLGDYTARNLRVTNSLVVGTTVRDPASFTISNTSTFPNAILFARISSQYNLSGDAEYRDLTSNLTTNIATHLWGYNFTSTSHYFVYIGSENKFNQIVWSCPSSVGGGFLSPGHASASLSTVERWNGTGWTLSVATSQNGFNGGGAFRGSVLTTYFEPLTTWLPYTISSANSLNLYWTRFSISVGASIAIDTQVLNGIWTYTGESTNNYTGLLIADSTVQSPLGEFTTSRGQVLWYSNATMTFINAGNAIITTLNVVGTSTADKFVGLTSLTAPTVSAPTVTRGGYQVVVATDSSGATNRQPMFLYGLSSTLGATGFATVTFIVPFTEIPIVTVSVATIISGQIYMANSEVIDTTKFRVKISGMLDDVGTSTGSALSGKYVGDDDAFTPPGSNAEHNHTEITTQVDILATLPIKFNWTAIGRKD